MNHTEVHERAAAAVRAIDAKNVALVAALGMRPGAEGQVHRKALFTRAVLSVLEPTAADCEAHDDDFIGGERCAAKRGTIGSRLADGWVLQRTTTRSWVPSFTLQPDLIVFSSVERVITELEAYGRVRVNASHVSLPQRQRLRALCGAISNSFAAAPGGGFRAMLSSFGAHLAGVAPFDAPAAGLLRGVEPAEAGLLVAAMLACHGWLGAHFPSHVVNLSEDRAVEPAVVSAWLAHPTMPPPLMYDSAEEFAAHAASLCAELDTRPGTPRRTRKSPMIVSKR